MHRYIFLFLLAIAMTLPAQETLLLDSLAGRLWRQTCLFPNEKIHLHTDRSLYMGGDTLWFRAYLVNAVDNRPEKSSRYIYAELINPFGEVVTRVKIRQDADSLFYGYLPLDKDLPGGEYTVRSYTRYMENSGEEFFFRKPIRIVTPFDKALETHLSLDGASFSKQLKGIFEMKNLATGMGVTLENVTVSDENGKVDHWTEGKQCRFKITPEKYKYPLVKLEASNYQQYFPLSFQQMDYQVDFLPEGGNLPAGVLSRMAFKALNTFGLSEEIAGVVMDEDGNEVCRFQTEHAGMGSFNWIPEAGKRYYAECVSKSGVSRRFDLPMAQSDVCSLSVVESRGWLWTSIRSGNFSPQSYILLIHERGVPLVVHPITLSTPVRVEKKLFSTGVLHFVLMSSEGQIISERLKFIRNEDQVVVRMQQDRKGKSSRKRSIALIFQDTLGKIIQGTFSVAVTNNNDMLPDSMYTIYTSLFLSSELRGHIENPGWYFLSDDLSHQEGADLLMSTQGWRKYRLSQALMADYAIPLIQPERSQRLTGRVNRLVGKKGIARAKVILHIPEQHVLEEVCTDEKGKFIFEGFEYPENTSYNLQALTSGNGKNVLLSIDTISFPDIETPNPFRMRGIVPDSLGIPVKLEFMDKSMRRVGYENGIRSVFLEDVVVTAPKRVVKTVYETLLNSITIRREEIDETPVLDLRTFIQSRISGLYYSPEGNLSYRGHTVKLIFNDFPVYDPMIKSVILQTLTLRDVEQIDFNRDEFAGLSWFPMTGGLFIAITLKKDLPDAVGIPKNIGFTKLLGYQQPVSYYVPPYVATDENQLPDLRTTLYWNPVVQTDEQGKASLEFYTGDSETSFSVVVEGVTDDGKLIRAVERCF